MVPRDGKMGPTWSRTLLDRAQSSSQQVTEVASIVKQQTLHNNRHNLTPDVHHHISSRSHFRGKRKIDTARPSSTSRHRLFSAIYQPAVTSPPSNKLWADMERIPTTSFSFSFAVGRCGSSSAPSQLRVVRRAKKRDAQNASVTYRVAFWTRTSLLFLRHIPFPGKRYLSLPSLRPPPHHIAAISRSLAR